MTLTWPNTWSDQNDEVQLLLGRIETTDRQVSPATYISDSAPSSDTDLATAWNIKKGIGIPEGSKTQWFNPGTQRVENIFVKVSAISPFSTPLIGVEQTATIEVMDSLFVNTATGTQATWTLTPAKNYISIRILGQIRSTQAAASTTLIHRFNGVSSANYRTRIHRVLPPSTFTSVTVTNQTDTFNGNFTVPAEGGNNLKSVYASFCFDYYYPFQKAHIFGMWSSFWDDGGSSEQSVATFAGNLNSAGAITSILFDLAAGDFQLGSWFIAYGVNPQ